MTTEAWIAAGIFAATLLAFAWGRLRPEVIAMAAVLAIGASGVASPAEAFAGFGDPTVITIASLFVVSAALERTGVALRFAHTLLRLVGPSEGALLVVLMLLAGAMAAVMNVVGAVVMLLPVTLAVCREAGVPPSRLLMPLAIAGRLGGALTLIGKPSNLVVSGLLVQAGYAPLSFFAFFPVGLALLAVGTAFTATVGRRLLPGRAADRATPTGVPRRTLAETYRLPERIFGIRVSSGSSLEGKTLAQASLGRSFGITVLSITRGQGRVHAPSPAERLSSGDELLVEARPEEMQRLRALGPIEVESDHPAGDALLETEAAGLAEVVVAPRSDLAGKNLRELEFRRRYGLNVLAVWRAGRPLRIGLAELPLAYGDALLVQGPRDRVRLLREDQNFIALDAPPPVRISRAPVALLSAGALVVLGASGLLPISLAAVLAAGIAVIGGAVAVEETFPSVDWRTVVVTAGLLPLGLALHTTGAAAALAAGLLGVAGHAPLPALGAVVVVAVAIGHVVPSVPSTILMAPIALGAATAVGASPIPFLIAVASATSASLATPISHPVSLMVMGPGGYRSGDYARVGGPLALLLSTTLLVVVALLWRF